MTRLAFGLGCSCGLLIALAGCGGDSNNGPEETGSVHVVVATIGAELDPDGYTVVIDGNDRGHVASQADSTLTGLPVGSVSVSLSGIADNCQAATPLPMVVNVASSQTTDAALTVTCAARTGFVRLAFNGTRGQDYDPDGFSYAIDGHTSKPIDIPGVVVPVLTGDHHIVIYGVAPNCEVYPVEQDFYVPPVDTIDVPFAVGCSPSTYALQAFTTTTGALPDPDGYTLIIDNGTPLPIGINDSLKVTGLAPGPHLVRIGGIAPNCFGLTESEVSSGANWWEYPIQPAFSLECPEVGTLRITTPIVPQTGFGFAFFYNNTWYPLGLTETVLIPNIPVGTHSYSVRVPEDGCVITPNTTTFTVSANTITDLAITLDCPPSSATFRGLSR